MLPWLFEAARPETTFCASYACPDLRKLISDTVSTAGGTDRIQQTILILSEGVDSYIGADSALAVLPARKHERQ
jgi:hypothetical protein